MLGGRLFRLASEAVGELVAILGQQFDDLYRRGRVQAAQEVGAAGLALIAIDTLVVNQLSGLRLAPVRPAPYLGR